ncbi:unnamed protein product [Aphanomyces euteiches]|nr:hypothetical protein AeRB84_001817 [Aphanomyces euteiches]
MQPLGGKATRLPFLKAPAATASATTTTTTSIIVEPAVPGRSVDLTPRPPPPKDKAETPTINCSHAKVHLTRLAHRVDEPPLAVEATRLTTDDLLKISCSASMPPLDTINQKASMGRFDLEQRLKRLELDEFGPSDPQDGAADGDRFTSMPLDDYMEFANSLELPQLRKHHAKLFQLVRKYQGLFSVASSISVEMNSNGALARIVEGVHKVIDVERVALLVLNRKRKMLCGVINSIDVELPMTCGIEGLVFSNGRTIAVDDVRADPRFDGRLDHLTSFTTRNLICLCVTDPKNRPVAILECANKATAFTSSDCVSLELIALIAGHTLHKLELFDKALTTGRRTSAILQVVKAVSEDSKRSIMASEVLTDGAVGTDTYTMIHKVIQVAKAALNCDRLTLYLCDNVKRELVCCVCKDSSVERFSMSYDTGLAGYVATSGQLLRLENCYDDPRFNREIDSKSGYQTVSMLCAPVISADGETVAVVQGLNKSSWPIPDNYTGSVPKSSITTFDDSDVSLLTAFCAEIATSLRRSTLEMLYHKMYQEMNRTTKRRDSVAIMVSSLLGVHSNDKEARHGVGTKSWRISGLVATAASRLMQSITRRRQDDGHVKPTTAASTSSLPVANQVPKPSASLPPSPSVDDLRPWQEKQAGFDDFVFDVFVCTPSDLVHLVVHGFKHLGLLSLFSIADDIVVKFVDTVRLHYRDNPYHSWWHGADVFQHVFALLNRTHLLSMLQPNMVLAMLVAAVCHDIDHPGTDNAYEIATTSTLALKYNDISVLEQHHASETFRVLLLPGCNILAGMSKPAFQTVRKLIIDGILQTDMKCHFDLVHDLEDAVLRKQKDGDVFDVSNAAHVKWMTGTILHASDIGAQTYPVAVAGQWSQRLIEEFQLLGEKERMQGLPVAPFRDKLDSNKAVGRLQLNFINYIVSPLWHLLMELLPGASVLRPNLEANRAHFQQMILEADHPELTMSALRPLLSTSHSASNLSLLPLKRRRTKSIVTSSAKADKFLAQQLTHQLSMAIPAVDKAPESSPATEQPKQRQLRPSLSSGCLPHASKASLRDADFTNLARISSVSLTPMSASEVMSDQAPMAPLIDA